MKKSLVYTRTGDRGQTSLVDGSRVSKANPRLEAYGTVDELNSNLGVLRSLMENRQDKDFVLKIQNCLFSLGGYLATDQNVKDLNVACVVTEQMVENLEREIDRIDETLPKLKSFVIPGGTMAASYCHVCRTVCRRVERLVIHLAENVEVDDVVLSYINRLSDYLFVLSRKINVESENSEIFWDKSCI